MPELWWQEDAWNQHTLDLVASLRHHSDPDDYVRGRDEVPLEWVLELL